MLNPQSESGQDIDRAAGDRRPDGRTTQDRRDARTRLEGVWSVAERAIARGCLTGPVRYVMAERFGTRLRRERERRQIALASIAATTKISLALLEGLERDDVSSWPAGIYRRSFIRTYAQVIGLEPEAVVREFLERHPDPLDVGAAVPAAPNDGGQSGRERPPTRLQSFVRSAISGRSRFNLQLVHRIESAARARVAAVSRLQPLVVKVSIHREASTFASGTFLGDARSRLAAVAWDAGVLALIALSMRSVLGNFWPAFGISTLCYYLASILILGNTPGVCLLAPSDRDQDATPAAQSLSRRQPARPQ